MRPGQMTNVAAMGVAAPTTYDLTSYYAAMSVQPDVDMKASLQTLMNNLKAAGITSKLRAFYPAIHDEQAARVNVMNPSEVATVHGSPNFTDDGGWKGNFSDGYLDSGIADNNAAPWSQNAGTLFAYCNVQPSGFGAILGLSASNATRLTGGPGAAPSGRIHNSTPSTGTTANSFGLIAAVRTSSTNLKLYRNGTSEAVTTTAAASAPVADTFTLFKNSATFGDPQVPVWGVGDQTNDGDQATLSTEIFDFLDPWGAS